LIAWRPVVAGDDGTGVLDPFAPEGVVRQRSLVRELPALLGVAVLIAFLLKTFIAQAFYIPSESMVPQLAVGDRVVVSKVSYRLHDPKRGDIVVFDAPEGDTKPPDRSALPVRLFRSLLEAIGLRQPSTEEFIKRVIALPGETVEGKGGKVLINGVALVEPYLEADVMIGDFTPVVVPAGSVFVMGDNRNSSRDSRSFGSIRESTIVGRAFVRAWPVPRLAFL
jgi:signal peptidase I